MWRTICERLFRLSTKLRFLALSSTRLKKYLGPAYRLMGSIVHRLELSYLDFVGGYHQGLGEFFHEKYKVSGNIKHLDWALEHKRKAADATPVDNPAWPRYLRHLEAAYSDRYDAGGNVEDFNSALHLSHMTLDLTPEDDHEWRAEHLQNLGVYYTNRYRRLSDRRDMEIGLHYKETALSLIPAEHPSRAWHLHNLATSYFYWYEVHSLLGDLDTAVNWAKVSLELTPSDHPARSSRLSTLVMLLGHRYDASADLKYLKARIVYAVELGGDDAAGKIWSINQLQSLASTHSERYQRFRNQEDLHTALKLRETALGLAMEPDTDSQTDLKAQCFEKLGLSYGEKYRALNTGEDLELGIKCNLLAVELTPQDSPMRAPRLINLASSYNDRYRKYGGLKDLEAGLEHSRTALNLIPKTDQDRVACLQNLAAAHSDRYRKLGTLENLDMAIQCMREAAEMAPDLSPKKSQCLQNLAVAYTDRYHLLQQPEDLQRIHDCYGALFNLTTTSPQDSWQSALVWAAVSLRYNQIKHAVEALQCAFHLLPEILWMGNTIPTRYEALGRLNIVQAASAAARLSISLVELPTAIELLEQGLGTIYQQMFQLRTNIDVVPEEYAESFRTLSEELYTQGSDHSLSVISERNELLEKIRMQPGLERFLLPMLYEDLSQASQGGPVVMLNSHDFGCDAIMILNPGKVPKRVAFSNLNEITNGRLWWLPTGTFSGLPLHACPPADCDNFIVSYTATLGSLIKVYSRKPVEEVSPPKLGIIGATRARGSTKPALFSVPDEVQRICTTLPESSIVRLQDETATVDAAAQAIQNCSWIHLACHARQEPDNPISSYLELSGGKLELDKILHMPLVDKEVVFLAACETAMGTTKLVNESFHLGGGFIAAGFSGAVGTLWAMADQDGPLVAELFYSHIFRKGHTVAKWEVGQDR
ncbi:CHAT domain-containing protein [Mycena amicta]|nr:CHAT domain-containing protein [Mycena amicta]